MIMKLWIVRNYAAIWDDNEEMLIAAETEERALEIFNIEDRTLGGVLLPPKHGDRLKLVVEEIAWPAPEGALLIGSVGS